MHVLILGAGPGGLTVAQCLRKQGISYEIFDRDESEDARFQGWAIGMHTIIDSLLAAFPSDLPDLKRFTNHLAPLDLPPQMAVHFPAIKTRVGFEDTPEKPFIRAERRRLRDWLATHISIQWGKHATRFEDDDNGVSVHFEDGTSAHGDILVGADGVKSRVRQYLLPGKDDLKYVPIAAIVGQLTLTGDAFRRQLELGHSGFNVVSPELGFITFNGLHHVLPDGTSGRFFWFFMEPDDTVDQPGHWLHSASPRDLLSHVTKSVARLEPKFREPFERTSLGGIKPHIWRNIELPSLPVGRVVLVGDAAHAMSPFRGEGGYHTFIDALNLSKGLIRLHEDGKTGDIVAVRAAMIRYNTDMLKRGKTAVRASRKMHQELSSKAWVLSIFGSWNPLLLIPAWLLALILGFFLSQQQSFAFNIKPLADRKIKLTQRKRWQGAAL